VLARLPCCPASPAMTKCQVPFPAAAHGLTRRSYARSWASQWTEQRRRPRLANAMFMRVTSRRRLCVMQNANLRKLHPSGIDGRWAKCNCMYSVQEKATQLGGTNHAPVAEDRDRGRSGALNSIAYTTGFLVLCNSVEHFIRYLELGV
jgi:hypothetical protein